MVSEQQEATVFKRLEISRYIGLFFFIYLGLFFSPTKLRPVLVDFIFASIGFCGLRLLSIDKTFYFFCKFEAASNGQLLYFLAPYVLLLPPLFLSLYCKAVHFRACKPALLLDFLLKNSTLFHGLSGTVKKCTVCHAFQGSCSGTLLFI